jgi:hypothetical protein
MLDEIYDSLSTIPKGPINDGTYIGLSQGKKAPSSMDTEPEMESQILLPSAGIPIITSSHNLSPTAGAELLRAMDQSRDATEKGSQGELETGKVISHILLYIL